MAQLAFAGLGAAIGSGFGGIAALGLSGTAIGWSIGGMIGGLFGPTQKVQGPRLADLKLTASTYGAPIPYVIGHPRIGGQIIWGSDRREISTTTSRRAKGGPKVKSTTFTYEIDLLIKLTCNPMAGIRKIFINGELQWTSSSTADFGSINASGALATRITVYRGEDDQLPDPTYESAVGIGNAPAYRGALTIMLEGLQLGNAGQIPNITFEVMETSEISYPNHEVGASPVSTWSYAWGTPQYGEDVSTVMVGRWDSNYDNNNVDIYRIFSDGTISFVERIQAAGPSVTAASGQSDEPVLMRSNGFATWQDGSSSSFGGNTIWRFAKEGDSVVYSPSLSSSLIYRHEVIRSTPTAPAPFMALADLGSGVTIESIVMDADLVYVLRSTVGTAPRTIYIRNREDLTAVGTITSPSVSSATLLLDELGTLHLMTSTALYRYEAGAWTQLMTIQLGYGAQGSGTISGGNTGILLGGILYTQPMAVSGGAFGNLAIRATWIGEDAGERSLPEVVRELCIRSGIEPSSIDATSLAGKVVRAYAVTPSTTRSVLEVLMQAYHFESVCAGNLRFVSLGGASAASIDFDELGTTAPGNFVEPLPISERNDPEMPAHITIKYMNVINDFQDGAERSSRLVTESEAERFIELPIGMLPSEAKQAADFSANITQTSLTSVSFAVQLKNFALQPTDVVIVEDRDGSTYRVRITKAGWSKGIYHLEAVFDSASAVLSSGLTDEDYEETSVIRVPSTTIYVLGDWPLFRDEDDNIGHYWAATGAGEFWPGAALMKSADDVVFEQVSQVEERGIVGFAMTTLGAYTGPNIPDERNSVRVNVGTATLSSITYAEQITETVGAWMIGAECVIARVATYVSPGVYDLRGLLRGRKGTEWAIGAHGPNERVAYIQPAGIRRVGMDLAELDLERFYRAVTFGKSLDSAPSEQWANSGVSSKPYAATNLDAVRNGTNITVSWNRRTRLSQNWLLGNVPLGESAESWVIDSYTDGTYTTIANTYTSTTSSVTFANANTMVYLRIYQLSDRVGRGYVLQGAI